MAGSKNGERIAKSKAQRARAKGKSEEQGARAKIDPTLFSGRERGEPTALTALDMKISSDRS
jgi:hypothetical protein